MSAPFVFIIACSVVVASNDNSTGAAVPRSGLVSPGEFIWGMNGHPLGGSGIYTEDRGVNLKTQFALLKELGIRWYRCDVFARDPDPAAGWDSPDELDELVPAVEAAGINLYPALACPRELRPYATLPERMSNERIYRTCFEHARKAASKWRGRIKVWDLLNELEGDTMKLPVASGEKPEHYVPELIDVVAAILKGQADGIRAGDPQARTSLNTGGWLHTGFVDLMIEKGVVFDILSWHWYSDMGNIDNVERASGIDLLAKLKQYGKPIWIGECNAQPHRQYPEKGQSDPEGEAWLVNTLETMYQHRNKGVEAFFLYQLLDQPSLGPGPRGGYGMVTIETVERDGGEIRYRVGQRKPVFQKVRKWVAEARQKKERQ